MRPFRLIVNGKRRSTHHIGGISFFVYHNDIKSDHVVQRTPPFFFVQVNIAFNGLSIIDTIAGWPYDTLPAQVKDKLARIHRPHISIHDQVGLIPEQIPVGIDIPQFKISRVVTLRAYILKLQKFDLGGWSNVLSYYTGEQAKEEE